MTRWRRSASGGGRRARLRASVPAVQALVPGDRLHSFLTPVLFLASMGLGLGTYVDASGNQALGACPNRLPRPGAACGRVHAVGRIRGGVPDHGRARVDGVFHAITRRRSTGATSRSATSPGTPRGCCSWPRSSRWSSCCSGRLSRRSSCSPIPVAALTGLAFAAPIVAFSATQRTPDRFNYALPLRDHAAVPVLGHVLPGRVAADVPPAAGLDHAAVARRRAVSRPVARDHRGGALMAVVHLVGCSLCRGQGRRRRPTPSTHSLPG